MLLALPGLYPFHPKDVILLPSANDVITPPDSPALDAAIHRVLARVR
jgi:hypothetical protein